MRLQGLRLQSQMRWHMKGREVSPLDRNLMASGQLRSVSSTSSTRSLHASTVPSRPRIDVDGYRSDGGMSNGRQSDWMNTSSSKRIHIRRLPTLLPGGTLLPTRLPTVTIKRDFSASASRRAIPLIPAGAAILKSTSLLAIVTTIARILISFFPLGTIAAFRRARIAKWLHDESRKPVASAEAEEFFLMWCQGEKASLLSNEEAKEMLKSGQLQPDGSVKDANGRIAYGHDNPVYPRGGRRREEWKRYMDPENLRTDPEMRKSEWKQLWFLKSTRFWMPPLPPAAEGYYRALEPGTREEVDKLRKYWASLGSFKDRMRTSRWIMMTFFILPGMLLLGVYIAALERTPFTGRWRIILLTPDEEDAISTSLAGRNWYQSVINLLTTASAPAPPILPITDWRWAWVESTLRKMEDAVVAAVLADSSDSASTSKWEWPDELDRIPYPARYPLRPRPRLMSHLHSSLPGGEPSSGKEHLELGPPYSLMLMQKDERNAFSYGFGGKGAGGIVVFSGLLDDILGVGAHGDEASPEASVQAMMKGEQPKSKGLFASLFGSITAPSNTPTNEHPRPTEEQTLHLACILAHEMGHLLLSHHLETLSQQQVLWPSLLGFTMDLVRAFIWPFTIFLGPAVNDALANMGRTSTEELANRYGEIGFQFKHEYEADLVGLRILAQAGYSPYKALAYFAQSVPDLHEIQPLDSGSGSLSTLPGDETMKQGVKGKGKGEGVGESWTDGLFKLWTRATHPSRENRLRAVQEELGKWEKR